MKFTVTLLCCALCAAIPVAHAGAASKQPTAQKSLVKSTIKKTKTLKSKKPRVKQAPARKLTAQPVMPASPKLVLTAPETPPPAAQPRFTIQPVASVPAEPAQPRSRNPYLAEQYAPVAPNPYFALPAVEPPNIVVSSNPYLPDSAAQAAPVQRNPYLAEEYAQAAPNPYLAAPRALAANNPYLPEPAVTESVPVAARAPRQAPSPAQAVIAAAPPQTADVSARTVPGHTAEINSNSAVQAPPRVARQQEIAPVGRASQPQAPTFLAKLDPMQDLGNLFNNVRSGIPLLNGQDLLPTIKKVYPTGEKPLVILSFKCPTEMIGVTPPPMKALHELVNFAFDGINKTNLLSFNMQQVCQ